MRTILSIGLKNELKTHLSIWRFLSKTWNLLVALITIYNQNKLHEIKNQPSVSKKIYLTSVGNCYKDFDF